MKTHPMIVTVVFVAIALVANAQNAPLDDGSSTRVTETKKIVETTVVTNTEIKRAKPGTKTVAIVVENRAGGRLNDQVAVLEDLVASRVAGLGFSAITREIVVNALNRYPLDGKPDGLSPGQVADRLLADNTTALRLAQNLGADYVLAPTIVSLGVDKRTFKGGGVMTVNLIHNLRLSYKLAEGGRGGAVAGDVVKVSKTIRQSAGLQVENEDIVAQLMDEAAKILAERIVRRGATVAAVMKKKDLVTFAVDCVVTEFGSLPDASLNEKNEVVLGPGRTKVSAMNVVVELNGAVVGSTPGEFQARPGFNKIRLSREGFKPFERTVNVFDGQTLTVPLQMSEGGYARWKGVVEFYVTIMENNRKLTDAEVKKLEGYAQLLSQSGYRVNTTEGIKIYKSIYDGHVRR